MESGIKYVEGYMSGGISAGRRLGWWRNIEENVQSV